MATQKLSLDGTWRLSGTGPAPGEAVSLDGAVPGHVHLDLLREGRIPDPFRGDGADACQWVEQWDWVYERQFTVGPNFPREWAILEFAGLDTYAEVALNGQVIGETANMHLQHRFEVGALLRSGANTLTLRFPAIRRKLEGKRMDYPAAFTSERVHVRRMQCTFHWDWVNRFVSYGIWRPVNVVAYDGARVRDLFVYTRALSQGGATLSLLLETESRSPGPVRAALEIDDPEGAPVWQGEAGVAGDSLTFEVPVPEPRLWWPAGYGEQPLYRARAVLFDGGGRELDRREVTFGIRTVAIEEVPDTPGSPEWERTQALRKRFPDDDRNGDTPGSSFTLLINGERIFCKGGNWVPPDPWPSRVTPEWYDRLVRLARDGNMNCMRTWGGGIYEPEAFWDACDRYGILICQDFQMACAQYPEHEEEFLAQLREEAPAVVRALRNHPSLAWWNGDNENAMNQDVDDPQQWGRKIATEITGPACRELDPSRPFYPTSPYGGKPNRSLTIGDCHFTGLPMSQAAMQDVSDYRERLARTVGRFHSECTSAGVPPMRSLLKFLAPEEIADPTHPLWYFHTKDNPYLDIRLFDIQRLLAEKLYGATEDVAARVARMEYVQHEWVRHTVEAMRRSKWYCSGILFWMYNDCWPATGWSLVDYYGTPKAGWYGMKRVCQPLIASIEDAGDCYRIWICNDLPAPAEGECRLRVQPWSSAPRWERTLPFRVGANSSAAMGEVSKAEVDGPALDAVLICDVVSPAGADRAWLYAGMPWQMAPPPATLSVRREGAGGAGRVVIRTDAYARVVTLDADLDFSDNYFDLLPGEERIVTWTRPAGAGEIPEIAVTCWNDAGAG